MTASEEKKPIHKQKSVAVEVPGRDLSTAGFAVAVASIFTNIFTLGLVAIVGLALSIIGRVQTSRAGQPNAYALAGIIIAGIVMVLTFAVYALGMLWLLTAPVDAPYHNNSEECYGAMRDAWGDCPSPEEKMLYPRIES